MDTPESGSEQDAQPEMQADDTVPRSQTPPLAQKTVKFKLGKDVRKYDSVDSILDKIDSGIHSLKPLELPPRSKIPLYQSNRSKSPSTDTKPKEAARSRTPSPKRVPDELKINLRELADDKNNNTTTYKRPTTAQSKTSSDVPKPAIKTYSAPDYRSRFSTKTPAHHMSAPNLETQSVCTEDFENLFNKTLLREPGIAGDRDSESIDTPRTEEFEQVFKTSFVKGATTRPPQTTGIIDSDCDLFDSSTLIKTRFTDSGVISDDNNLTDDLANQALDTVDEMSDLEQDIRYNSTLTASQINAQYDASSESELDSDVQQIRADSLRIQREMELERKANKLKQAVTSSPPKRYSPTRRDDRCSKSYHEEITPAIKPVHQRSKSGGYSTGLNQQKIKSELARSRETLAAVNEESAVLKQLTTDKMKLLEEISQLQAQLKSMQEDVYCTEHEAKENRSRAEESRSQLMLAEFKREAASKELKKLTTEIEKLTHLQSQAAQKHVYSVNRQQEMMDKLGITPDEVSDLISERNQLRALVDKRNTTLQLEKDELEKQLSRTKQEMFTDQKNTREKLDSLEEKIDSLKSKVEQSRKERDSSVKELESSRAKCETLEQKYKATESTSLQVILDRDRELETLREQSQRDLLEFRMQLNNELTAMKKSSKVYEDRCLKQEQELRQRDIIIDELRCECASLRARSDDIELTSDVTMKEMKRKLQELEEMKQREIKNMKQQYEVDQANLLSQARVELDKQHQEVVLSMKTDYENQISQQQTLVHGKDEEICLMRSRLHQQEEATRNLAERLRIDAKKQMDDAVKCERELWEKEHEFLENQQLKHYKHEMEKQISALKDELETEKRQKRQTEDQYSALKSELEEQRNQNNRLYQEKVETASRAKQQSQEETCYQLEKLREKMEEDQEKVVDKLKSEILSRDDENQQLKADIHSLRQGEDDICLTLEKMEKMIISEINDECKKTAHLLGVTPRKTHSSGFSPKSKDHKKSRTMAASAIANLRACNEELRNTIRELREDAETLKIALNKTKKSKELELSQLRKQLTKEKSTDMDDLKMRLTQIVCTQQSVLDLLDISESSLRHPDAHSTDVESDCECESSCSSCDCVPTNGHSLVNENMQQQYLLKMDRKLSERAMHRSLRDLSTKPQNGHIMNGSSDLDDSFEELGAAKLQRSVQERLKQLRIGTPIRRATSQPEQINVTVSQASDTDSAIADQSLNESSALEQRVKLAELKAHLAEERAARNQTLLNAKLQEVNHLQSTLNSQTKEILGMERSFDELRHGAYSPTRFNYTTKT